MFLSHAYFKKLRENFASKTLPPTTRVRWTTHGAKAAAICAEETSVIWWTWRSRATTALWEDEGGGVENRWKRAADPHKDWEAGHYTDIDERWRQKALTLNTDRRPHYPWPCVRLCVARVGPDPAIWWLSLSCASMQHLPYFDRAHVWLGLNGRRDSCGLTVHFGTVCVKQKNK